MENREKRSSKPDKNQPVWSLLFYEQNAMCYAAILGLIPLAIGVNLDFAGLFRDFGPHFFIGGDSPAFWAPMAWTMIYGLSFATFLTLIVVPAMCLLSFRLKDWISKVKGKANSSLGE